MFKDPIVEEVRVTRLRHAARFDFDLRKIAEDLRIKERQAGRKTVSFPPKPAENESTAGFVGENRSAGNFS
jgi:hypothetical protein